MARRRKSKGRAKRLGLGDCSGGLNLIGVPDRRSATNTGSCWDVHPPNLLAQVRRGASEIISGSKTVSLSQTNTALYNTIPQVSLLFLQWAIAAVADCCTVSKAPPPRLHCLRPREIVGLRYVLHRLLITSEHHLS